jgi:baseplate J-like protein
MSTAALATLLLPLTKDAIRARIISGLQGAGFPTGDWAPTAQGGLENGVIDMVAGALADLLGSKLALAIAAGFLDFGTGDWLAFWAKQFYLLDRNPATSTIQAITLTCAVEAGPYTVAAGDLIVIGAGSIDGANRYQSIEGGTIPKGAGILSDVSAVVLQFQAESPGAAFDDAPLTITTLVTSLAGVTARNARILTPSPAALVTGGASTGQIRPFQTVAGVAPDQDRFRIWITASGQGQSGTLAQFQLSTDDGLTWIGPLTAAPIWNFAGGCSVAFEDSPLTSPSFVAGDVFFWANTSILTQGSDAETDTRLATRCRSRFLTLSDVPSVGTVEIWAKTAAPEVARVRVLSDANVANTMLVYLGSSSGRASPGTVIAVQKYISDRLDSLEAANVFSVDTQAVAVTGSVQVPRLSLVAVQTQAEKNWTDYLASIDIGGTVRLSELQQAVMDAGALDYSALVITGGSPNLTIGSSQVAVPPDGSTLFNALGWEPV